MLQFSGAAVRTARESAGLTREELAVGIGRGYSAVVQYESGGLTPSTHTLVRLADALGVELGDLFTREAVAA